MNHLWLYQNRELYPITSTPHHRFLAFVAMEDMTWREKGLRILCADPPPFAFRLVRACEAFLSGQVRSPLPSPSLKTLHAWSMEPPLVWLRAGRFFRHRVKPIWHDSTAWVLYLGHLRRWVGDEAWIWIDDVGQDEEDREIVSNGLRTALALGYWVSLEVDVDDVLYWYRSVSVMYRSLLSFRIQGISAWRAAMQRYQSAGCNLWLQVDHVPHLRYVELSEEPRPLHVVYTRPVGSQGLMRYVSDSAWEWTADGKSLLWFLTRRMDSR